MAGKHSSLWDHLVWVYLPPFEQGRLTKESTGTPWVSRVCGLSAAVRTRAWLRLSVGRRRTLAAMGIGQAAIISLVVYLLAVGPPVTTPGRNRAPVVFMGAALSSFFLWFVYGLGATSWRANEHRALKLRRRRTRIIRREDTSNLASMALSGRRRYWRDRLIDNPDRLLRRAFLRFDRSSMLWTQTPIAVYFVFLFTFMFWGGISQFGVRLGFVPMLLAASTILGAWMLRRRFRTARRRLLRAIDGGICPDCEYDLSLGRPDPRCGGIFGPHRCVECGSPWPLVPPPVPSQWLGADEQDRSLLERDLQYGWKQRMEAGLGAGNAESPGL